MSIIALQTATDACSAALSEDGKLVFFRTEPTPRRHGELVAPMLSEALSKLQSKAPDAIAIAAGPGSYTGLRIGASAAKGVALALGIPMVAVPTLQCIAHAIHRDGQNGEGDPILCLLHARASEWYGCWFSGDADQPQELVPAVIKTQGEWKREASSRNSACIVIGSGSAEPWQTADPPLRIVATEPTAQDVAILAEHMLLNGETVDVDTFEPAYLRDFVARTPKQSIFEKLQF